MAGELVCPMCQGATDPAAFDAMIWDLICERDLSEEAESVLRAVWAGGGRPVEAETIFDELYCWDPQGGPSLSRMYQDLRAGAAELADKLPGTGLAVIRAKRRDGWVIKLTDGGAYVL
jgi:hypothetical protein